MKSNEVAQATTTHTCAGIKHLDHFVQGGIVDCDKVAQQQQSSVQLNARLLQELRVLLQ
jgi:hypothetical protein